MTRKVRLSIAAALAAALLLLVAMHPASATPSGSQSSWGAHLTCSTDSSGYCTVPHPAGVVPDAVVVTPELPAMVSVDTLTAASFRLRFTKTNGSGTVVALTGTRAFFVHVDWSFASPSPSSSSSPSASPSVSPSSPPPTGFPDASNTGIPAGTTLTTVNGNQTITTANTVIDGKDIHGCVEVRAPGVVIKNSKVSGACFYAVASFDGSGGSVTVQDSEVDCANTTGTAFSDSNFTALRVNVHGCENGFDILHDVTVKDSYVHDLFATAESHTDGAQLNDAANNVLFDHNSIDPGGNSTSAIISPPAAVGGASNVTIQNNRLGGGAYTLYCVQAGAGTNYKVLNNRFRRDFAYGAWTDCTDEAQVTGNVYDNNGAPLN